MVKIGQRRDLHEWTDTDKSKDQNRLNSLWLLKVPWAVEMMLVSVPVFKPVRRAALE